MKKFFPILVLIAALSLATVAAYYSVFGISKLFSSQAKSVIIMAGILEVSKLITASYLEKYWKVINWIRKTYLTLAVLILMFITSLGIYGFLVSAYQETAYKVQEVEKKVMVQQTKKKRYQEQLVSITTEKESLNKNITELTTGLANNKIQRRDREGNIINTTSGSTRRALEKQLDNSMSRRDTLSKKEQTLSDSISSIDLKVLDLETNSDVAAEIGPLKYVAKITGKDIDRVVNWFILLFIFVFDPLAIMLLVSANKALRPEKTKENIYGEIKITKNKLPIKPPKIIKTKTDNNQIISKRKEINEQIKKVLDSGLSEKRRNIQIDNLKSQLPKDDDDLSKEY
jgi:cell division protein FtsB